MPILDPLSLLAVAGGLDNQLLTPLPANSNTGGSIQCRERLVGILEYSYREPT